MCVLLPCSSANLIFILDVGDNVYSDNKGFCHQGSAGGSDREKQDNYIVNFLLFVVFVIRHARPHLEHHVMQVRADQSRREPPHSCRESTGRADKKALQSEEWVSVHVRVRAWVFCARPGQNLVTAEAMFSRADRASEEGKAWMASRALLLW